MNANLDTKVGKGQFQAHIEVDNELVCVGTIRKVADNTWLAFPKVNNGRDFYFSAISHKQAKGICETAYRHGPYRRTRNDDYVRDKNYEPTTNGFLRKPRR
jgi:hypothetical protein